MKICASCSHWNSWGYTSHAKGDCDTLESLVSINLSKIPTLDKGEYFEEASKIEYITTDFDFYCAGWTEME